METINKGFWYKIYCWTERLSDEECWTLKEFRENPWRFGIFAYAGLIKIEWGTFYRVTKFNIINMKKIKKLSLIWWTVWSDEVFFLAFFWYFSFFIRKWIIRNVFLVFRNFIIRSQSFRCTWNKEMSFGVWAVFGHWHQKRFMTIYMNSFLSLQI